MNTFPIQAAGVPVPAQIERRVQLPRRQRGVVLFIALIVLVAMTLAGIAMVRSVDTTLGIAGNMAFRQTTIQSGELGVQTAYNWLQTQALLSNDMTVNGESLYFSSVSDPDWFNDVTWQAAAKVNGGAADAAGNTARYVIHRMCTLAGQSYAYIGTPSQTCATDNPLSGAQSGNSSAVGGTQFAGQPLVYFRVTVRVDGPRNTIAVTQVNILMVSS